MKNKTLAYIVLVFAVLTEYLHLLFEGVIHSYYDRNGEQAVIYLSDMIYYFVNESFTLFIIAIIFAKLGTDRASKSILAGVFFWYFIEWIEIFIHFVAKIEARLYVNDGSWLQLITCGTIVLLVSFWNRKISS
jgi:hypothetical protein